MQKTTLFFAAVSIFCLTTSAIAQSSFGLRVAANLANVSISSGVDIPDTKAVFGPAFGIVAEIGAGDMLAFQPELLYSGHGFGFEEESLLGETVEINIRYNYLQIPLLAKLKLGSEAVGINIVAGPHLGFGIGDITAETMFLGEKEKDTSSWEDAGQKKFDLGVTGGVGLTFPAGPGVFGLDARYQLGLTNIIEDPDEDEKASNRVLQVGLSFLIPIGN
jgi:hypothetical protein